MIGKPVISSSGGGEKEFIIADDPTFGDVRGLDQLRAFKNDWDWNFYDL